MNQSDPGMVGRQDALDAHIAMEHSAQAERSRPQMAKETGMGCAIPADAPVTSGLAAASQWSDRGLLHTLETLAAKYAPGTDEYVLLMAAAKRMEELLHRDHVRGYEVDKLKMSERQAQDRLRLARLALGGRD